MSIPGKVPTDREAEFLGFSASRGDIRERIAETLGRMVKDGEEPRAMYLAPEDYHDLHKRTSDEWEGSALVWPLSFCDVPIINKSLVDKVELPVRRRTGAYALKSTIYAKTGRGYPIDLP